MLFKVATQSITRLRLKAQNELRFKVPESNGEDRNMKLKERTEI
jgi:hypothetical protein